MLVQGENSVIEFAQTALRTGLIFGSLMAVILGSVFGGLVVHGMWSVPEAGPALALWYGLIAAAYFSLVGLATGAPFGVLMALFPASSEEPGAEGSLLTLDEDESLLREGSATWLAGGTTVIGRLFLTDKRLWFQVSDVRSDVIDRSWPLDAITEVHQHNTQGLLPNGLRVSLTSGQQEQFSVVDWRDWVSAIEQGREPAQ